MFRSEIRSLVHPVLLTVNNIVAIIDSTRFYKTVEPNIFIVHTFLRYRRTSCGVSSVLKYTNPNLVVFI